MDKERFESLDCLDNIFIMVDENFQNSLEYDYSIVLRDLEYWNAAYKFLFERNLLVDFMNDYFNISVDQVKRSRRGTL